MTQLRNFTSLEQSKKLAEILPIESADMAWCNNSIKGVNYTDKYHINLYTVKEMQECFDETLNGWDKYWKLIPSWSLSALLAIINKDFYPNLFHDGETWNLTVTHHDDNTIKYDTCGDDPLDIIYRMIVFLHDENLI